MIDTQEGFDALVKRLAAEPELAIDCEMDSMYAYGTSLCLVQLGWPEGEALIDGLADLDRSALGRICADGGVVKIFHGGENDIGLMRDRWGFDFANTFDTMAASQVLGRDGVGLASVLEHYFEVNLSKKYQKADWRVRPLPDEQAEYARLDVRYLISLRRLLLAELQELCRVEEAECEFARIARASIEEKPFDPENWGRVKGARELDPGQRGVLRAVFIARDAISRRLDRAPYRVMHDSALITLARRRPRSYEELLRTRGINRHLAAPDAKRLVEAVKRGIEDGEIPLPPNRGRRRPWDPTADGRLTPEQAVLFDALRRWRVKRAEKRGVDVARVATTALLAVIARAVPLDVDVLAGLDGMEPWRIREYGEDIVGVVRKTSRK